jgi:hypothetical protein
VHVQRARAVLRVRSVAAIAQPQAAADACAAQLSLERHVSSAAHTAAASLAAPQHGQDLPLQQVAPVGKAHEGEEAANRHDAGDDDAGNEPRAHDHNADRLYDIDVSGAPRLPGSGRSRGGGATCGGGAGGGG